jgi:predicted Ser/Thr protein kinase
MSAPWELPGYDVEELVGFGGSGEVWRARTASGERVALKRMHRTDAAVRERLRREAAVLSSVAGDHVVRLRDVVVTETEAVLVMDYAEGGNLATVLAVRGRLAAPEIVTLVGPLAAALADGHDRGLVHGDVTPTNILFTADGRPLLADFGVARAAAGPSAPGAGAPPAPAADVHALCTIADEALRRDGAPEALVAAIESGLAADPHDRPTARQLAIDVLRCCAAAPIGLVRGGTPVSTPIATPMPTPTTVQPESVASPPPEDLAETRVRRRLPRPRVPQRLVVGVVAATALVLAVAGGVMWGHGTRSSAAVLPRPPATAIPQPAATPSPSWSVVVAALEKRRAAAFAAADPGLLHEVYTPTSAALRTDVATLQSLRHDAVSVRGFVITTTGVRMLRHVGDIVVLRVVDAMSSYQLVRGDGAVMRTVPARGARAMTVTLRQTQAGWRIDAISR